jgi:hypothetical protein
MKNTTPTPTKYRLKVWSLNTNQGWVEYNTLPELQAALASEEDQCRDFARGHAEQNRSDFDKSYENPEWTDADTDSAIESWINDEPDENGNRVHADVAVFYPEVEAWIVDADGDGEWQDVNVRGL